MKLKYILWVVVFILFGITIIYCILYRPDTSHIVMVKDISYEESTAIGSPCVVKQGDVYYMVYAQGNELVASGERTNEGSIGLAISKDGVTWEKKGTILRPVEDANWNNWFLDTPAVILHQDTIYLYYFGDNDNSTSGGSIGLATSTDWMDWVEYDDNPILTVGEIHSWDSNWVESPTVIYDDLTKTFHMYYTGIDENWVVRMGHATSDDGFHWRKDSHNPVLQEPYSDFSNKHIWDGSGAAVGTAFINDQIYIFYASQSVKNTLSGKRRPEIGLAYSEDGSNFERYTASPILVSANTGNLSDGPYNPSALYEEGRWKIWYETGVGIGYAEINDIELP